MPTTRFCAKCGLALKVEAAIEVDKERKTSDYYMDKLREDPEVRQLIQAKIRSWVVQEEKKEVKTVQP
jgi:hypothetical protein